MKIFISYKRENQVFAEKLRTKLLAWNYEVWIDIHNIPLGAKWADEIQKGLEWADVTIGIMTELALRSENVKNEWDWTLVYQHKYSKRLILMRLDDCIVPMQYIRINWIDVHQIGENAGLAMLNSWLTKTREEIPASPSFEDPFQEYLELLYEELVEELDFLVLSVERLIDITGTNTPHQVEGRKRMLRSFSMRHKQSDKHIQIDNFTQGFINHKGRVLLLGDPGAGKTITLLITARDAVLTRLQDSEAPLPILGRIATWQSSPAQPLHEWLAEFSTLSSTIIRQEIEADQCVLFFDGLDELFEIQYETRIDPITMDLFVDDASNPILFEFDARKRFMELIPSNNEILVTCRVNDYERIGEKLHLNGAIKLHHLSDEQIEDYLSATPETTILWENIRIESDLLEVIRTPLLLSLLAFSYKDLPIQVKQLNDLSADKMKDAIFEGYIKRRYEHELLRYEITTTDPIVTFEELVDIIGGWATLTTSSSSITPNITRDTLDTTKNKQLPYIKNLDEIINLCTDLHILAKREETFRFAHLYIRDFLIWKFCEDKLYNKEFYTNDISPAMAIGSTSYARSVNILTDIINTPSLPENIRKDALIGLGKTGQSEAISTVIPFVKSNISSAALTALRLLGADSIPPLIDILSETEDKNLTIEICNIFVGVGPNGLDNLLIASKHESLRVRREAIFALGCHCEHEKVLLTLNLALAEKDWKIREYAAFNLERGKMSDSRIVDNLISVLNDDSKAGVYASAILKRIGTESIIKLMARINELNKHGICLTVDIIESMIASLDDKALEQVIEIFTPFKSDTRRNRWGWVIGTEASNLLEKVTIYIDEQDDVSL